jgi:transcriptional regulator with XRE-family HTH domain
VDAIILKKLCKLRLGLGLARPYSDRMVDSQQVRAALRQLRTDAKLTPEEFADEAGVDRATVYRIEDLKKKYAPKIETVSALTESRGLTLTAFFSSIEGLPAPGADATTQAPSTRQADHGGDVSDRPSSAESIVERAFIEELARQFVGAIDRLISARAADPRSPRSKPADRRRARSAG